MGWLKPLQKFSKAGEALPPVLVLTSLMQRLLGVWWIFWIRGFGRWFLLQVFFKGRWCHLGEGRKMMNVEVWGFWIFQLAWWIDKRLGIPIGRRGVCKYIDIFMCDTDIYICIHVISFTIVTATWDDHRLFSRGSFQVIPILSNENCGWNSMFFPRCWVVSLLNFFSGD